MADAWEVLSAVGHLLTLVAGFFFLIGSIREDDRIESLLMLAVALLFFQGVG